MNFMQNSRSYTPTYCVGCKGGYTSYLGFATEFVSPACFIMHARAAHETCFNSGTASSSLQVFQSVGDVGGRNQAECIG